MNKSGKHVRVNPDCDKAFEL